MAFTKKDYVEGQTVITAQNMNDINESVSSHDNSINQIQNNITSHGTEIDKIESALGGGSLTSKLQDYIVEQGTSDIWYYRKWNSGVAECWGEITETATIANPLGSVYESYSSFYNWPSGLFSSKPKNITFNTNDNAALFVLLMGGSSTATHFRMRLIYPMAYTSSYSWHIGVSAIGFWK